MTITTETQTIHSHIDGGTFRTLAFAETSNRWGITITEWTTYKGQVIFEVNRENPHAQLFCLGKFETEAEARAFANRKYRADKGL